MDIMSIVTSNLNIHKNMELLHQGNYVTIVTTLLLAIVSLLFATLKRYKNTTHNKQPPKASGAWPIIGHLPLLHPSKLPHRVLGTMADKHGPIFSINLGANQTVVVCSSEMAKECLLTNDKATSGRPESIAVELMSYNYALFGFSPYGSYWRNIRKIVVLELLSNQRVNMLSYVWKLEINAFMKNIYEIWNNNNKTNNNCSKFALVDMKQLFGELNLRVILRIVCGKQFDNKNSDELDRIKKATREMFKYVSSFSIGDVLPRLRWLDIGGEQKAMKRVFKELDDIVEKWLQEHKEKRNNKISPSNKEDQGFMDVMLSVIDRDAAKDCPYDVDTIIKSTCLGIITGGSDTSTAALTWALSLLMNNPQTLKRAKNELDLVVGKERQVSEHDIPKLHYLHAIVKETLRLCPPGPLMGPREFIEDCTIGGYNIKRGTRLIVNLSKIFVEPKYWENPIEFQPERFLGSHKDIDVTGQDFEFFPFGAGRRICPGISFGLQAMHLTLATVLHGFELVRPNDEPIDMSESFGLTNLKKEPLNLLVSPTLFSGLYTGSS